MKIGIISDTHGLIHRQVFKCLEGSELVLHAGDVGDENILMELESIAPVKAVFGNTDSFPITNRCKSTEIFEVKGKKVYLSHVVMMGNQIIPNIFEEIKSVAPHLVVFGHTHDQYAKIIDDILFFNPGSGGQRRPGKRLAVGIIHLANGTINHEICYLD